MTIGIITIEITITIGSHFSAIENSDHANCLHSMKIVTERHGRGLKVLFCHATAGKMPPNLITPQQLKNYHRFK
jgi:hypothetical protein